MQLAIVEGASLDSTVEMPFMKSTQEVGGGEMTTAYP